MGQCGRAMFSVFFTEREVRDYASACTSVSRRFAEFFRGMLERGVYLAPSQYEAVFVSLAHTDKDIDFTLQQAHAVLSADMTIY